MRGRELLLQVVQQDPEVEQAWWWLSQALDDPRERMRALEHVVRINPDHPQAAGLLSQMRQQEIVTRTRHNPHWTSWLPDAPLELDDKADDPCQCPYCGLATDVDDRRCPHCGGGLFWRVSKSPGSGSLRQLLLLMVISLALGVIEALGPAFALGAAQAGANRSGFQVLQDFFGVRLFLGSFLALAPGAVRLLLEIYAVRTLLLLALILGLHERWRLAYYAAILAVLADLLLGLYLLATGYLGPAGVLLNLALAVWLMLMLVSANYEFAVNHVRLLVKPDASARSAVEMYERGHHYRRLGMWAMAVAHWRRAVGLAPQMPQYFKDLGIGYAQTKRFERSLQALQEAQRQAPGDTEIDELVTLVQAKSSTHRLLRH